MMTAESEVASRVRLDLCLGALRIARLIPKRGHDALTVQQALGGIPLLRVIQGEHPNLLRAEEFFNAAISVLPAVDRKDTILSVALDEWAQMVVRVARDRFEYVKSLCDLSMGDKPDRIFGQFREGLCRWIDLRQAQPRALASTDAARNAFETVMLTVDEPLYNSPLWQFVRQLQSMMAKN